MNTLQASEWLSEDLASISGYAWGLGKASDVAPVNANVNANVASVSASKSAGENEQSTSVIDFHGTDIGPQQLQEQQQLQMQQQLQKQLL
jgi:hypothetical protein